LNIVFDLGGVVVNWLPDTLIRNVFTDPDAQELVRTQIIEHADWVALDKGTLSFDQAVVRGAERTGLPGEEIERLLNAVPASLTPKQDTFDLIRSVSDTENRLFVLSNMHLASADYLEQQHDIWELFDGLIFSSRIKMVKPDLEIFEHLLSEHELSAPDTVFIDDLHENVAAAASIGIKTIRFEDADQCRQGLVDFGCF
jgi:putative hydrolase of the HAD superfamily